MHIAKPPTMTGPLEFVFLDDPGNLIDGVTWQSGKPILWLYNLHYFDDLLSERAGSRLQWHVELMRLWVKDNTPAKGIGWDPYPLSLRVVNWLKWHLSGHVFDEEIKHSLAMQMRHLSSNVEWHLLGNHVLANAKALIFGGACFNGSEANGWLHKGLDILAEQLAEQILSDGGHFERSPMYHAIILEDILDVLNLAKALPDRFVERSDIVSDIESKVLPMIRWLDVMSHPDGEISFFNDAAIGIASNIEKIVEYASRLDIKYVSCLGSVEVLTDSGYVRLTKAEAVIILDVAEVGPSYQPGHAHADTLSFEMSLFGRRLLVNSGTSTYENSDLRHWQRSTASHNTVEIDGRNSSDVWSAFRVAQRAYPFNLKVDDEKTVTTVECSHNGYSSLGRRCVHTRRWVFSDGRLLVRDQVTGPHKIARAVWCFVPHARPSLSGNRGEVEHSGKLLSLNLEGGLAESVSSSWYPSFGRSKSNQRITVTCQPEDTGAEGTSVLALHMEWNR